MSNTPSRSGVSSTIAGYFERLFMPQLIERNVSKSTIERHADAVKRFIEHAGNIAVNQISEDAIEQFLEHLWEMVPSRQRFYDLSSAFRRIVSQANRTEYLSKSKRPPLPPPKPGTVRHYFESVYAPRELLGCQKSTIECYRGILHQMHGYFEGDVQLSELTDGLVLEYFQDRLALNPKGKASINRIRSHLFAIWRHAYRAGKCCILPSLKKLPQDLPTPDSWSPEEMKNIIAACDSLRGKFIEGIPSEKWWRTILTVGYYTALRRRALFDMQWTCIDLRRATITIPGTSMKGRKGQKYRIGEDAAGFLRQIMKPRRKLVFPHGSTFQPIHEDFDRILTAAKIRGSLSRTPHFHKLRRTTATIVADKKGVAAAAELLSHRREEVTQRYIDRTQLSGHDFTEVLTPLATV